MSTVAIGRFRLAVTSMRDTWPLLLGFASLAVPTVFSLAFREWARDFSVDELVILAVSAWLFWRQWPQARRASRPGAWPFTAALLSIALPMYVFGRAYDFPTVEAVGLYAVGIAMLQARFGLHVIRGLGFPLLFIALAIPLPRGLLDALTAPLKELVSYLAASGLALLGLPVARQGVIILVAQYQLLVEDACSGMNSLIALTGVNLLYGFLTRGPSLVYLALMASLAVPVAIAANVFRVALLVIFTYVLGDGVAQSFLHFATGIVLFSTSLILIFAVDKGLQRAWPLKRRG